jgi:6,7-dimethyl-8-ribityllumazine synthase
MKNTTNFEDTSIVCSFPIGIVTSIFNRQVTKTLQEGTIAQLLKRGIHQRDLQILEVPGAIEIPLIAKRLAMQNKVQSIIALGAVIRGDTSHYDVVCNMVGQGCLQVSLEYNIPVLLGVLTTENEEQAWDRLGGKAGHKGIEVANAAISVQQTLKLI